MSILILKFWYYVHLFLMKGIAKERAKRRLRIPEYAREFKSPADATEAGQVEAMRVFLQHNADMMSNEYQPRNAGEPFGWTREHTITITIGKKTGS